MFSLKFELLFTIILLVHSVDLQNITHRRVFNGVIQKTFKYPFSAAVRVDEIATNVHNICSGILIGAKQVLSSGMIKIFQNVTSFKCL